MGQPAVSPASAGKASPHPVPGDRPGHTAGVAATPDPTPDRAADRASGWFTAEPPSPAWPTPGLAAGPPMTDILDACPAVLVVVDPAGIIHWSNQAFRGLAQRPEGDLVGRPAWDWLPIEVALSAAALSSVPARLVLQVPEQVWSDPGGTQRRIAWTLSVIHHPDQHHDNDGGGVGWLLATGVDVTRERTVEAVWRERAHTDPLTGLANRTVAQRLLQSCLLGLDAGGCAVLLCDLDSFKAVNDTHGHATGDQVLQHVARTLAAAVGPHDLVARLGGDEFLLILPAADTTTAHTVAATIQTALAQPLHLDTLTLQVGVSIGLRVAGPGEDPSHVLHDADQAMYTAKTTTRAQATPLHRRRRA